MRSPQALPLPRSTLFHIFPESKLWFRKRIVQGQRQALSHARSVERVGVSLSNRRGKNNWYSHGRTEPTSALSDSARSSAAAALQTNSSKRSGVFPEEIWQFATAQNISAASLTCQWKLCATGEGLRKHRASLWLLLCDTDYKISTT